MSDNDKKTAEREVLLRKSDDRCAIMENELRQKVQGNAKFIPANSPVLALKLNF